MKVFHGICKECRFHYAVADRVPNYCPECGKGLWMITKTRMDVEAFKKQSTQFVEATEVKSETE